MTDAPPVIELVGRSSSHFTRVARMFALELGVPHRFRPVFDLAATDPGAYADNPALKLPILVDEQGSLFGTENICRALVGRSSLAAAKVVLRGDVPHRIVANVEELTLHVMSSEVSLIMAKAAGAGHLAPPKVAPSLHHSLRYLDANFHAAVEALPKERAVSFFEVALFCVVTHLEFREVADTSSFVRLREFCRRFSERPSAQATPYRFDTQ
jgi:glutathione S-transferase